MGLNDMAGWTDTASSRLSGQAKPTETLETRNEARLQESERRGFAGGMDKPSSKRQQLDSNEPRGHGERNKEAGERSVPFTGRIPNPWDDAILIPCSDGKWRIVPSEPAFFPLAPGVPGRVGRLRGYGNSIVPPVAAKFIRLFMDQHLC